MWRWITASLFRFGIGAGWYEQEYRAYGYTFPDAVTRLAQLGEAVQIILKMWTEENPVFVGKYYQIQGAINQPKGVFISGRARETLRERPSRQALLAMRPQLELLKSTITQEE